MHAPCCWEAAKRLSWSQALHFAPFLAFWRTCVRFHSELVRFRWTLRTYRFPLEGKKAATEGTARRLRKQRKTYREFETKPKHENMPKGSTKQIGLNSSFPGVRFLRFIHLSVFWQAAPFSRQIYESKTRLTVRQLLGDLRIARRFARNEMAEFIQDAVGMMFCSVFL